MSGQTITVLVTGVGGASLGEQCLKALRSAAHAYRIVGTDLVRESVGLAQVDVPCVVPPASDAGYVPALLDLCARHDVRVLIPTSEPELLVVSAARDAFADAGVLLPINRHELIAAAEDKARSLDLIAAAGVRVPDHAVIEAPAALSRWRTFPCVLKPASGGSGSANVFIAQTPDELHALGAYVLAVAPRLTVEEYVGDATAEFTVGVLHDLDGRLIHSIAIHRRILTGLSNRARVPNRTERPDLGEVLAVSSGISQGVIDSFPEVTGPCEALAEELDSRGPLNIQCRLHAGEPVVFEINPRFSGTTSLRALAGFNEPDLLIRYHVRGEQVPRRFDFRRGTVVRGLSEAFYPEPSSA